MKPSSYSLDVDNEKKIVTIKVIGDNTREQVEEFQREYIEKILPLTASEYLLLLDSLEMEPPTERLHQLQISFALYRKSGFTKIVFIILNDTIRNQVLKLIRFSGIDEISDISYVIPSEVDAIIEEHVAQLKN